ncbi:MAG: hypothetical protein JXA28_08490 [Bacteroidetes bacterium]|nr:hypothetical protein [Bacteroidota bacterium]
MKTRFVLSLLTLVIAGGVTVFLMADMDGPFDGAKDADAVPAGVSAELTRHISPKPWTRWWWFADVIRREDVRAQLVWLRDQGFGGVEIAWVYPLCGDSGTVRQPWLSEDWSRIVAETASLCDSLAMGCDFTFGTLWPFGDSHVPPEDGALTYGDSIAPARMRLTWEHPVRGRVIDHLSRNAFLRYAGRMYDALDPALRSGPTVRGTENPPVGMHPGSARRITSGRSGAPRGLFCDSWEVETRRIWTRGFDALFLKEYGYDIRPLMDSLYAPGFEGVHYDYMKLVSRLALENFYEPFTASAHERGAYTRVQCCGSPTDLLAAYARVDIPESEAILFEPAFARIPASAAALGGKTLVSSETFTCIYGWKGWPGPGPHQGEEQIADLKLLADALFAHGVNHLIWHGTPYNPPGRNEMFYASVHVAPQGALAPELRSFNAYLAQVSEVMRRGRTYSDIAVYLPIEDAWMGVELPDSLQFPWAWGEYELRYQRTPEALRGRQPLWINAEFLRKGYVRNGRLHVGNAVFNGLYVDARFLDVETLQAIRKVAEQRFPVCVMQKLHHPGRTPQQGWEKEYRSLMALSSVTTNPAELLTHPPLVEGKRIPDFWCREENGDAWVFFPHPLSEGLRYPLRYGIAGDARAMDLAVRLHWKGRDIPVVLRFGKQESLLLHIRNDGTVELVPLP